jgi:hypothetical protein
LSPTAQSQRVDWCAGTRPQFRASGIELINAAIAVEASKSASQLVIRLGRSNYRQNGPAGVGMVFRGDGFISDHNLKRLSVMVIAAASMLDMLLFFVML